MGGGRALMRPFVVSSSVGGIDLPWALAQRRGWILWFGAGHRRYVR